MDLTIWVYLWKVWASMGVSKEVSEQASNSVSKKYDGKQKSN